MIVVSNTTPILSLYKIGRLELLSDLFKQVIVPQAVYNEISILGRGKPGHDAFDLVNYISVKQIENVLAASLLRSQLDYGEAETIVLAQEMGADVLILDEKKARKIAQANSQKVIGTIGILQMAKDKGLIPNIKTALDALIENGIWINQKLYKAVIDGNGE